MVRHIFKIFKSQWFEKNLKDEQPIKGKKVVDKSTKKCFQYDKMRHYKKYYNFEKKT